MDRSHCDHKDVDNFLLMKQLGTIASDLRGTLYKKPANAENWQPVFGLPSASAAVVALSLLEKSQQEKRQLPALEKRTASPIRETARVASILFTQAEVSDLAPCSSPFESLCALFPGRKRSSTTDSEPFKVQKVTEIGTSDSQNAPKVETKGPYLTRSEQKMLTELRSTGRAQVGQLLFTLESPERAVDAQSHIVCAVCKSRMIVQSVRGHMVTKVHRLHSNNDG